MNKSFKLLAVTLVSFAMTNVHAVSFLGMGVGYLQGHWDMTDIANNNVNFNKRSHVASLFGGYGNMLNPNVFLGGEASASLTNTASSFMPVATPTGTIQAKLKQTYSYGLSLLPGVVVAQGALLYLRAGFVRTRFAVDATNPTYNVSALRTGRQIGVGLEYAIAANLNIGVDLSHVKYKSLPAMNSSITLENNQLMLNLIYKSQ